MKIPMSARHLLAAALTSLAAVGLVALACTPPTDPSTLNPDPLHGGLCKNGDQGCTPCPDPLPDGAPRGCWAGFSCTPRGGCAEDPVGPDLVGARAKDAGGDR